MAYNSGHDTFFMGTTAARNGLTALTAAAGETNFTTQTNGTVVVAKGDQSIIGAFLISEAVANIIAGGVGWRWHNTTDPSWNHDIFHFADQTGDWSFERLVAMTNYPFKTLTCEVSNNNNAQLEVATFLVAGKPGIEVSGQPFGIAPKGCRWAEVTAATATTADTVTRSQLNFTDYPLDPEKRYRVFAANMWAADLYAYRLVSMDSDDKPGGPGADTQILGGPTYWKPFGCEFSGLQGLWADFISEGADTVNGSVLIMEL